MFSWLHNITIEQLMADGVSWRCLSCFSGPWQCNLLGSQWERHKPPGFYLKLYWNDMRVKWFMTIFILEWSIPLKRNKWTVNMSLCGHWLLISGTALGQQQINNFKGEQKGDRRIKTQIQTQTGTDTFWNASGSTSPASITAPAGRWKCTKSK